MVSSGWLNAFKVLASVSSMVLCLSPVPSTYAIHKQQKTSDVELLPLVTFLLFCHTWMLYGYATHDNFPLLVTFAFGDLMSLVYIGVFYRWTADKRHALRLIAPAIAAVVITTVYTALGKTGLTNQSDSAVQDTVGYFTIASSVLLYLSPLATVRHILQTRNAASVPVALCAAGLVENVFWSVYGVMESDPFIWGITIFCVLFSLLQVVLYFVFPPQKCQDYGLEIDIEVAKLSALSRSSLVDYKLQSSPKSSN